MKKVKKRQVPPINRRVAQLMIDIQDELRLIEPEILKAKKIENIHLTKLIVTETIQNLCATLKLIESK